MDKDLDEAKATGEDSYSADPVTAVGGPVKKRRGDAFVKPGPVQSGTPVETPQGDNNAGVHEALDQIFGDADLTEEFKTKTSTLFEAILYERTEDIREQLQEQFESDLTEQAESIAEEITDKLDMYLGYVVENWMKENEVALETDYRVHVAESILTNVRALVEDHNIEINESDIEAVNAMQEAVDDTNAKYNALVEEFIDIREEKEALERNITFNAMTENMITTDVARLATLAEGISYENLDDFAQKLAIIKESYFTKTGAYSQNQIELLDEETENTSNYLDPSIAAYVTSLNNTSHQ